MSIMNGAMLVKAARKEGLEEAAKIIDRESDRVMRSAEKAHNEDDPDYDEYERLESEAAYLAMLARRVRNAKRRSSR